MTTIGLGSIFAENDAAVFYPAITGGGAIAYNAGKTLARCTATAGAAANFKRQFYLRPGEEIVAEVEAWAVSGEGRIGFDVLSGPNKRADTSSERIVSGHMQNYIVRHKAQLFKPEVVQFWCGVVLAAAGDVWMRMPRVQVQGNSFPSLRVLASGLLQVTGGAGAGAAAVTFSNSYPCFGLTNVAMSDANTFTIELTEPLATIYQPENLDDNRGALPFLSIEPVGNRKIPFQPKAFNWIDSDVTPVRNKIDFTVINCATAANSNVVGNLVDWNAYSGVEYFKLLAYTI